MIFVYCLGSFVLGVTLTLKIFRKIPNIEDVHANIKFRYPYAIYTDDKELYEKAVKDEYERIIK